MANRIPRAATRLRVSWKISGSACPAGTITEAYKNDQGWHMDVNGKTWYLFVSMLRNSEICDIEVV